jgi:hypothetical protein F3_00887
MERTWKMFFKDSKGRLREKIIYVDPQFIFYSDSKYHNPKKSMIEIEYQNMEILGKNFYDEEIGVAVASKDFNITYQKATVKKDKEGNNVFVKNKNGKKILFIMGHDYTEYEWAEDEPSLWVKTDEVDKVLEKINQINEKYGILCRAEKGNPYYYINEFGEIKEKTENLDDEDNKRYDFGNYFTLKNRAEIFLNRINEVLQIETAKDYNNMFHKEHYYINTLERK